MRWPFIIYEMIDRKIPLCSGELWYQAIRGRDYYKQKCSPLNEYTPLDNLLDQMFKDYEKYRFNCQIS